MIRQFFRRLFFNKMRLSLQILDLQLKAARAYIILGEIRNDLLARSKMIGGEPFPSDADIYLINKIESFLKEKEKAK